MKNLVLFIIGIGILAACKKEELKEDDDGIDQSEIWRLEKIEISNGTVMHYEYDSLGFLKKEIHKNEQEVSFYERELFYVTGEISLIIIKRKDFESVLKYTHYSD